MSGEEIIFKNIKQEEIDDSKNQQAPNRIAKANSKQLPQQQQEPKPVNLNTQQKFNETNHQKEKSPQPEFQLKTDVNSSNKTKSNDENYLNNNQVN